MTTIPKWTDERTTQLQKAVGTESPVTRETVAKLATDLSTSPRSVASKLRKMGVAVETAGAVEKKFSEEVAEELKTFVEDNSGKFTYAEIAKQFNNGEFTPKQIQGKILSMELTKDVAPTPKTEVPKSYTDEEEAKVVSMCKENAFVEDIAKALDKPVPSIRGKALSLLRAGTIDSMPKQRDVKGAAPDAFEALGDVSEMKVEDIATKLSKTARGVKTMLTRRGVKAADYDGATKHEKAQTAAAA